MTSTGAQSKIKIQNSKMPWRKGQDSNLQGSSPVVFKTTALPVRLPFRRKTNFVLCTLFFVRFLQKFKSQNQKQSTKNKVLSTFLLVVHAVGLEPTKFTEKPLIYSQVL